MKKLKIKYIVYMILLTILLCPCPNVWAKDSLSLKVDKTDIEVGKEIAVSAHVSDELEAYSLMATLQYDKNVFQVIDEKNFLTEDSTSISYNEENNKFGLINKKGETKEQGTLFTVYLKVKENASTGTTNIALTNISYSDGNRKETLPKTSVKVSVIRDAMEEETLPINKENKIKEEKNQELSTFTNVPILGFLAITFVTLFIVMIVLRIKRKNKPCYFLLGVDIIIFAVIFTLAVSNENKKDVNQDGKKDYEDAEEIIDYLIDIENEKEETKEQSATEEEKSSTKKKTVLSLGNYDINNDGKVDINDAAHVTQEVTQKTTVTLKEVGKKEYAPKGKITLKFNATITPNTVQITKVKIVGKYYAVKLQNKVYSITLDTPKTPGLHKFVISSVVLNNGKEIKTNLTFSREILKDAPTVHLFDINDEENTLTFSLLDVDKTFKEGHIKIYDINNIEVYSGALKKENIIKYAFEEEKDYQINVWATYDLDSEEGEDNFYEDTEIFSHLFRVYKDYNFQLTDVAITDILQPGQTPVVSFVSTNNKAASIEVATLNNQEYNIKKRDNNNYEVELTKAPTTPGKHQVTLDSVELSTLKLFHNEKDYQVNALTYQVLKVNPKVTNINLSANKTAKTVKATFDFTDKDQTLIQLRAVLVDSTGRIVDSKVVTMEELYQKKMVELTYGNNLDGLYKVEFLADYALGDKYRYTSTNIGEQTIEVFDDIYIKNITIKNPNTKYPVKGQKKYEIIFDVHVGQSVQDRFTKAKGFKEPTKYTRLSAITINGLNYVAEGETTAEVDTYRSRISLTIPEESGIIDLKISRIQMQYASYYIKHEDFYSIPQKEMQIEVLKDVPTINNLKVVDDYEEASATFDFDVVVDEKAKPNDESFKEGTIELNGKKVEITRGHNTVKFEEMTKDQNFDVIFKGNYDLDTDTLEEEKDQNEYQDKEFYRTKYGLYDKAIYDTIQLENVKEVSTTGTKYFEKNENIKLQFNITGINEQLNLNPEKIVIDGCEYLLTKTEEGYEAVLNGYTSSGKKAVTITDIVLDNGKKVTLQEPVAAEFEVLKDPVTITDYKYELLSDTDIKVTFAMKDYDQSLVNKAQVKIVDEEGQSVFDGDYADEITFKRNDEVRYYVTVVADYDRDVENTIESDNYYSKIKLLEEIISLDENNIELKDITEISLYKGIMTPGAEETILVDEITKEELERNLSDYFVEINMETLPSTKARIKNVTVEENHLILVLDYQYVTRENSNKEKTIRVDYGLLENGVAKNETHPEIAVKFLLERLAKNEDITLTQNYDMRYAKNSEKTYIETYTGTLKGNGHTIKNLTKPLFGTINGGKIENLIINNVTFDATGHGALANTATNATIKEVLIERVTRTASNDDGYTGGFIGSVANTKISSSRVKNAAIRLGYMAQNNGVFLGAASNNSEITNCYAEGSLNGGWNFTSGFVGNATDTLLKNNYLKVSAQGQTNGGGSASSFGEAWNTKTATYENNVCIATGTSTTFVGNYKELKNNYFYLENSEPKSTDGVTTITKDQITEAIFKQAKFQEEFWRLKEISYDNLPTLKIENTSVLSDTTNEEYDEEQEVLYKNLSKLMPFYDSDEIIEKARNITDNNLKTKEITHILPIDGNGDLVSYVTNEDLRKISKIKIVYKTKEKAEYRVIYDSTYDMVANYRIPELKIDYNYQHYVINTNSQVVNNLTNYLTNLTYTNNLDSLTVSDDSRIYRDYYNEVTSKELKEFVLKFLANSNYTNTTDDEAINNYIEREVKEDKKIEKTLYMYNYFKRWYTLDIGGMDLSDFMLFHMRGFDESLTPIEIANLFLKSDSNFNTGETNTRYKEVLGSYTHLDTLAKFLEYMVKEFSDEQDMSNWVRTQFKGYLVEIPVEGHSEVYYTLWDHFNNEDAVYHNPYKVYNFILPILTLPENAAYIVSSPVQFVIGAQRTYIVNPDDPVDHETLVNKIDTRVNRMINYYKTAYGILEDPQLFNNIHTFHTDKRYTYDENGVQIYQQKGSTEEPFHKNFNEVVGQWAHSDGNNAVAWGDRIDWSVAGFLDGTLKTDGTPDPGHTPYNTWSHESAHNIDARLFLKNNGRRYDGHGEDYADANLTQGFNKNDIVMNLSINFNPDQQVASNLRPDRINTKEKVWSFYSGVFDSIYVMDYLEALAFLKLDPKDQATVSAQVSYPNASYADGKDEEKYLAQRTSKYTELTEEDFKEMNLQSVDDLIDHKIMIIPGLYKEASRGVSLYGGEGLNTVHWYQPNNPYGRPDSYSLKWIAYEMLGYKGYDNGYVEYYSNIHPTTLGNITNYKTDEMALKTITENQFSKFDDYKKARFNEVKEKLDRLNKEVNVDSYVQKLYEALKQDAEEERVKLEDLFTRKPNCLSEYWCLHGDLQNIIALNNSSNIRYEIYYKLKTLTDDFNSKIYADSHQQDVNVTINKES